MISFKAVTKEFPTDTIAVKDITFSIDPGEFVFITGPSGAGKTTLGRLMIREFPPTSGEIIVGDYQLTDLDPKELPGLRQQIGFVFQDFKLLPDRTIGENIALVLEVLGKSDDEVADRVYELLKLTGLEGKENLFPHQVSGGELQRAVIARALASEPAVLFADEPTGNLDADTAWQIIKLLKSINETGTTIIMATHNQDIIGRTSYRIIKLDQGQIIEDVGKKSSSSKTTAKTATKSTDKEKKDPSSASDSNPEEALPKSKSKASPSSKWPLNLKTIFAKKRSSKSLETAKSEADPKTDSKNKQDAKKNE